MVIGGVAMKEKKTINMEIGAQIQSAREKAGMTQERFGELVGLGTKSVSAIERGAVGVSLSSMKKICQVLAVSSDTLLFGPAETRDMRDLTSRLERLSPEQYAIAERILNALVEGFALNSENSKDS
jgi:transcriptional regulator with XRE-family HTH domain